MKQTFLVSWFFGVATSLSAQAEIKLPYKPAKPDPAPASVEYKSPQGPAPVVYSASSKAPAPTSTSVERDAEARRAAALAKVQGKQLPPPAPAAAPSAVSARQVAPATYSTTTSVSPLPLNVDPDPATTVTVNGLNVQRTVRPGRGQVGNELFTPVSELHFVQFAVYCKDTPVDKAPPIEGLYLLWHPGSTCPGGAKGASYIVKGYTSPEEAKAAVAAFKARGIDCWYNPALTGAEVEIIGVR